MQANKRKLGLLPNEPTKRQKAAAGGSIPGNSPILQGGYVQQPPQAANLDASVHLQVSRLLPAGTLDPCRLP